ncbi:MAG: acyl-CoA dehydrogenase family protein [Bacteroidales bacterium]|nr:acyl-CoA dehydrogenase family protein [Bacteroidales bacterium]
MTKENNSSAEKFIDSRGKPELMPFPEFISELIYRMKIVFGEQGQTDRSFLPRGIPSGVLQDVMALNPLSVCIPQEYGGRGGRVDEILAMLSAASYESLALSLTLGINSGLFIQPVAKYAKEDVKVPVFKAFMTNRNMGGLMITEPDFGSDALNMQTMFSCQGESFHIRGTKHWAGLTGAANYWLLTARERTASGKLKRDIDFFICDVAKPGQHIVVEELFDSLGLHQIPYGRNKIDVTVPVSNRLIPKTTGINLLLDLLHRSRLHFPGMALGFIQRMMDEAFDHCRHRLVGGQRLIRFDQVQQRLARIQASYTIASAMCAYSSHKAGLEHDLSTSGMVANSIKSFVTDLMQEAAQSLVQLAGAKAYRFSHIGGRGIVDSRPFQIFEGSNDMLYTQVAEGLVKRMKKVREHNLFNFFSHYRHTEHAAKEFKELLQFDLINQLPQRKLVELGQITSRIISAEMLIALGSKGFRQDLVENAIIEIRHEISGLLGSFNVKSTPAIVDDYDDGSSWFILK